MPSRSDPPFTRRGISATECLVHLIRHARRADDSRAYNALLPLLLARCEAILNNKIDSEMPGAVELREDILGDLAELFAIDGTEDDDHKLDFFEIRFNMAFSTFRITRVRQALGRSEVQLPEPSGKIELPNRKQTTKSLRVSTNSKPMTEIPKTAFSGTGPSGDYRLTPRRTQSGRPGLSARLYAEVAGKLCDVNDDTIRNRLKRVFAKLSKKLKEDA